MVVQSWQPSEKGVIFLQQLPADGIKRFTSLGVYCPVCYAISKDLGVFSRPQDPEEEREVFIRWEVQLDQLASSADDGCRFCSFMACRFFDDPMYTFMFHNGSSHTVIACCGSAPSSEKNERVIKAVTNIKKFAEEHPDAQITIIAQPSDQSLHDLKYGKVRFTAAFTNLDFEATCKIMGVRTELILEFYAVEDNPAADYIQTRPININPASEASIHKAQAWIEECLHHHSQCPGPGTSKLPTRVVKILDDDNLVLIESEGVGSYTTLSYVWGGPQTFALSSDTIDQNLKGFKVSDLPQTLQDAIFLTKRLGHEYIWIDALCIIQDSVVDRDNEIPKMPQYYQNSYVTISAGLAAKATTGFLKVRDECEKHPGSGLAKDLLTLPYLCPDGRVGEVLFREESMYCLSQEPVSCRAWTLQERMLSPRVLIYGSRLLWQCNTCQCSNGGVEDWSFDLRASDHRRIQLQFMEISNSSPEDSKEGESAEGDTHSSRDPYDVWHRIVHEYSYLNLTLPQDKLPAVSGLAIELSKLSGDEYLAGLWRSQLLRELMWSTYPDLQLSRPSIWRAPSWSWASVDNQISFDRLPPKNASAMAEITDCSVTPRSSISSFGEVIAATLKIKGPLLEFGKDQPDVVTALASALKHEHQLPPLRDEDKGLNFRRTMMNAILPQQGNTSGEWIQPESISLLVMFARPREHVENKTSHSKGATEQEEMKKDIEDKVQDTNDETRSAEVEEGYMKDKEEDVKDAIEELEDGKNNIEDEAKQVEHKNKNTESDTRGEAEHDMEDSKQNMTEKLREISEEKVDENIEEKLTEKAREVENKMKNVTDGKENETTTELFKDDAALLSCLVLVKQEDGKYERIASLTSLSFKGMSALKERVKDIEIV